MLNQKAFITGLEAHATSHPPKLTALIGRTRLKGKQEINTSETKPARSLATFWVTHNIRP